MFNYSFRWWFRKWLRSLHGLRNPTKANSYDRWKERKHYRAQYRYGEAKNRWVKELLWQYFTKLVDEFLEIATPASTASVRSDIQPTTTARSAEPDADEINRESSSTSTNANGTSKSDNSVRNDRPEKMQTSSPSNPCVLCLTEEKQVACIPCGHFISCVPCGHSLRTCPLCRAEITAFVRIYVWFVFLGTIVMFF